MPGRVAGGDRALRRVAAILAVGQVEDRLQAGERLGGRVAPRPFVGGDDRLAALRVAHGHRRHLGIEPARIDRGDRPLVARQRERVLVLAADVVLDRDALGVGPHVAVLDRAPQAVVHGRVEELARCRAGTRIARRAAGTARVHGLHAAGDATSASPARISAAASMIAFRPEPQTRLIVVAEVVSGSPAAQGRLAGRRLADSGLQDLAHQDFVDAGACGPARPARRPPGSRPRRVPRPGPRRARRRTCRSGFEPR